METENHKPENDNVGKNVAKRVSPVLERNWNRNYLELEAYIQEHHQLPDKKKEEGQKLLNWWKYNKRLFKHGKLDEQRAKKLRALSLMRIVHVFEF